MPAVVADASMVPVTGFTKIATGYQFSCGIKTGGTVWCWWNTDPGTSPAQYGQLGDGTTIAKRHPVQVLTSGSGNPALTNVVGVSTYSNTTCAVTSDQSLYCWGYGYYGQLGIGSPAPNFSAYAAQTLASVGVPFTGADQVSVGSNHVCARKTDGTAYCWGYNAYGQLGNGGTTTAYYPVQVPMLSNQASEIASGDTHTCARSSDIVLCWGNNSYGLGDGTTTSSPTPINVKVAPGGADFTGATELRASGNGACVLKAADRSIWCWGYYGTTSANPAQASPAGFPVSNVFYWDIMSGSVCFARTDAELYLGTYKATHPVACLP
jgi:alpha-tubulin suppressor-like RCC1 family protein